MSKAQKKQRKASISKGSYDKIEKNPAKQRVGSEARDRAGSEKASKKERSGSEKKERTGSERRERTGSERRGRAGSSERRDRLHVKDPNKRPGLPKKGGAGGKGTWGKEGIEAEFLDDGGAIDENDPNYEAPHDLEYYPPVSIPDKAQAKFQATLEELNKFKIAVKTAAQEYLESDDADEFIRCIKERNQFVFHQDIPYIVVKLGLDVSGEKRTQLSALLAALFSANVVTDSQMAQGFRKLYNSLDDLLLDAPNAKTLLRGFVDHGVANGYLDVKDATDMQKDVDAMAEEKDLSGAKAAIGKIIEELFVSFDIEEGMTAVAELNKPHLHFEVVKRLVSQAFDRSARVRNLASRFLAAATHDAIKPEQVVKGFTILLQRVEDYSLDVPDVLRLLACFLARAVADEALPPAFLARVDLREEDMGFQVVTQARELLQGKNVHARMQRIWREGQSPSGDDDDDDDDAALSLRRSFPASAKVKALSFALEKVKAKLEKEKQLKATLEQEINEFNEQLKALALTALPLPSSSPSSEVKHSGAAVANDNDNDGDDDGGDADDVGFSLAPATRAKPPSDASSSSSPTPAEPKSDAKAKKTGKQQKLSATAPAFVPEGASSGKPASKKKGSK